LGGYFNKAVIVYYVILGAAFVFYDLVCEIFINGQSFGKRVMKIRVISLSGSRPTLGQFLLRWLFRMIDFSATGGVAALISAAISEKGQRLGDLVAGTALIKTVPRAQRDNIIFSVTDSTYQPVFTQVSQLSDKDIELIHEVIDNYYKSGNNLIVYNLADKMREHLGITLPPDMNSMKFLQTIIKDYSHITAHADAL
jgi:hypothetical protein